MGSAFLSFGMPWYPEKRYGARGVRVFMSLLLRGWCQGFGGLALGYDVGLPLNLV